MYDEISLYKEEIDFYDYDDYKLPEIEELIQQYEDEYASNVNLNDDEFKDKIYNKEVKPIVIEIKKYIEKQSWIDVLESETGNDGYSIPSTTR